MHDHSYNYDAQQPPQKKPVFHQQINGKNSGYNGSTEVDGNDCGGPIGHIGNDVPHTEEGHLAARVQYFGRQLINGYIHVASQQGKQQQGKDIAWFDPQSLVGVPQDPNFDQNKQC